MRDSPTAALAESGALVGWRFDSIARLRGFFRWGDARLFGAGERLFLKLLFELLLAAHRAQLLEWSRAIVQAVRLMAAHHQSAAQGRQGQHDSQSRPGDPSQASRMVEAIHDTTPTDSRWVRGRRDGLRVIGRSAESTRQPARSVSPIDAQNKSATRSTGEKPVSAKMRLFRGCIAVLTIDHQSLAYGPGRSRAIKSSIVCSFSGFSLPPKSEPKKPFFSFSACLRLL